MLNNNKVYYAAIIVCVFVRCWLIFWYITRHLMRTLNCIPSSNVSYLYCRLFYEIQGKQVFCWIHFWYHTHRYHIILQWCTKSQYVHLFCVWSLKLFAHTYIGILHKQTYYFTTNALLFQWRKTFFFCTVKASSFFFVKMLVFVGKLSGK